MTTLQEIKSAHLSGQTVCWKTTNYQIKGREEDNLVVCCTMNNHCTGLTDDYSPADFFIKPVTLTASATFPVTIYYCKAGVATGQTVRISQSGPALACSGVRLAGAFGEMVHGNSAGKAKASGARCVLTLTGGSVEVIPGSSPTSSASPPSPR